MATAPSTDEVIDEFLSNRGHQTELATWEQNYNKTQCPDCGALHDGSPTECSVCGWAPAR